MANYKVYHLFNTLNTIFSEYCSLVNKEIRSAFEGGAVLENVAMNECAKGCAYHDNTCMTLKISADYEVENICISLEEVYGDLYQNLAKAFSTEGAEISGVTKFVAKKDVVKALYKAGVKNENIWALAEIVNKNLDEDSLNLDLLYKAIRNAFADKECCKYLSDREIVVEILTYSEKEYDVEDLIESIFDIDLEIMRFNVDLVEAKVNLLGLYTYSTSY